MMMKSPLWSNRFLYLVAIVVVAAGHRLVRGQGQPPPDHPSITVRGQTYTPRSILARNMGTSEDQTTAFPPHKIIGNVYYVGTRALTSFLITTPQGAILVNTTYERNVPVIQKSVEELGFKFSDVKIVLGNHAHGDHQLQSGGANPYIDPAGCKVEEEISEAMVRAIVAEQSGRQP